VLFLAGGVRFAEAQTVANLLPSFSGGAYGVQDGSAGTMSWSGTSNTVTYTHPDKGFNALYGNFSGSSASMQSLYIEGDFAKPLEGSSFRRIAIKGTNGRKRKSISAEYVDVRGGHARYSIPLSYFDSGDVTQFSDAQFQFEFGRADNAFTFTRLEFRSDLIDVKPADLDLNAVSLSAYDPSLPDNSTYAANSAIVRNTNKMDQVPGHAVWVYGFDQALADRINAFNAVSKIPVRHIYSYNGSIGVGSLGFSDTNPKKWRDAIDGGIIHINMDGHAYDRATQTPADSAYNQQTDEQRNRASYYLADQLEYASFIRGVHFDLEPHIPAIDPYYTTICDYIGLSVSIALGASRTSGDRKESNAIDASDNSVLMMYDLGAHYNDHGSAANNYANFTSEANGLCNQFKNKCRDRSAAFWVGIGFNYGGAGNASTTDQGYAKASLDVVAAKAFSNNGGYYRGIAIWGASQITSSNAANNATWNELKLFSDYATPPTADAGADKIVEEGAEITMDGSGSSDNGTLVDYSWELYGKTLAYGSQATATLPGGTLPVGIHDITLYVTDGDGAWAQDTVTVEVMPSVDTDGDGYSDWEEYMFGTSPSNSASFFRLLHQHDGLPAGSFGIKWPSVTGRVYEVEYRENLTEDDWQILTNNLPGTGLEMMTVDGNLTSNCFYRIKAGIYN
jgi:hypothetical protein